MIAAYHGKTDYSAAELLAVNPFAPAAQTAARLWECDRSPRPRKMPPCPSRHPYTLRSQRMKSR
jgi:hypothetical protein